jgi:hypothetical protein
MLPINVTSVAIDKENPNEAFPKKPFGWNWTMAHCLYHRIYWRQNCCLNKKSGLINRSFRIWTFAGNIFNLMTHSHGCCCLRSAENSTFWVLGLFNLQLKVVLNYFLDVLKHISILLNIDNKLVSVGISGPVFDIYLHEIYKST